MPAGPVKLCLATSYELCLSNCKDTTAYPKCNYLHSWSELTLSLVGSDACFSGSVVMPSNILTMTLKSGRSYNYRMIASECHTYYTQYNTDFEITWRRAWVLDKHFFFNSSLFPPLLYAQPNLDLNLAWRTHFHDLFINPQCACAARVTVLGVCVCVCVCVSVCLHLFSPYRDQARLISDTNSSSASRAWKVMWRFA